MELLPKIKERRMEAHLSQKDVVKKVKNLTAAQLSEYEHGKKKPNTIRLFEIAYAIGCKTDDLYEVVE